MPAHTKGRHTTAKTRLKAPATLSTDAAAIFVATVQAVDPDHFSAVDRPLLEQYAGAADLARKAQQHMDQHGAVVDGKASPYLAVLEKASRSCVALSARLRICPQSRFDRLVAGANSRKQPHFPSRGDGLLAGDDDPDPLDEFLYPPPHLKGRARRNDDDDLLA